MNTNPNAKRILIFGDSFTFGKIPGGTRYDSQTRFTGILQETLGTNYEIIEEGLRGRTIQDENGFFPHRNGIEQFGPIIGSHLPIDLLVIFLGTNDSNSRVNKNPQEITEGLRIYKEKLEWWCNHLGFEIPNVLLIAPPKIDEQNSYKPFGDIFKGGEEKTNKLPELYRNLAAELQWQFFDTSTIVTASTIDGVHLDVQNNKILGIELAKCISDIFNK